MGLGMFVVGCALYFLPTIVGREKANCAAIFTLNLLLGWTVIGWVAAMVWATTVDVPRQQPALILPSCANTPAGRSDCYCTSCGNRVDRRSRFCGQCGASLPVTPISFDPMLASVTADQNL